MPISVTKNISKPISKVQTDAFITENNYKPPGTYSNDQQRNRSFHKSNVASNDQSLNRKFDSKRYTPNSSQICLGFNRYSKPFCTLENTKCKYGRQHKYSLCTEPSCRALNHNASVNSKHQHPPGRPPGFYTLLLPRGRDLYLMTFPGDRVFAYP